MKALSIKQPWLWAIMYAGKRIENRSWKPPDGILNKTIALHASKRIDRLSEHACYRLAGKYPLAELETGAILAVARIAGYYGRDNPPSSKWAVPTPYCWQLCDIEILKYPIFCKGALRFWEIPANADYALLEQTRISLKGE